MAHRPFARTSAALAGPLMVLRVCGQTLKPTSPSDAGTPATEFAPALAFAAPKYAPKIPGTTTLLERKESGPGEFAGVAASEKTIASIRHDFKTENSEPAGYVLDETKASWKKTANEWVDCVGGPPTVCLASSYEDGERPVGDPRILNPTNRQPRDLSAGPIGTFQFVGVREEAAYFSTWGGMKDVHVTGFDADGAPVVDKSLRMATPETAISEIEGAKKEPSASADEKVSSTHEKASPSAATKRPKTPRASSASPSSGNSPSRAGSSGPPSDAAPSSSGPSSNGIPSDTPSQKKSVHGPAARPPASQITGIRTQMTGFYLVVQTDSISGVHFIRGDRFVRKGFDGACVTLRDEVACGTEPGLIGIDAGADDTRELETDVIVPSPAVKSDPSFADAEAGMRSRLGRASGVGSAASGEDVEASTSSTQLHDAGGDVAGKGTAGEGSSTSSSDAAHPLPPGKRYLVSGPKAPVLLSAGDRELSIDGKRSTAIGEAKVKGVDPSHDVVVTNVETHGKFADESKAPIIISPILIDGNGVTVAGVDRMCADQLLAEVNGGDTLRPYSFAWQGSRLAYMDPTETVIGVYRTAEKGK